MTSNDIHELITGGLFPVPCHRPRLVETHISWVIICDDHVFKIKKPMHYSFLDFSTAEKRKYYCEREVMLNNRLTTDVYLGVLPVCRAHGSLTIGGPDGEEIDCALKMRRLDSSKQMDVLLKEHKVSNSQITSLAKQVAGFHRKALVVYPNDVLDIQTKFNDLANERNFVQQQLSKESSDLISAAVEMSDRFLRMNESLLRQRMRSGFIRDCHGDLHSRNIFLLEEPVIFDCIEFNDDYRCIDVLNEVAFLCMDLDAFGRSDLAELFMQTYNVAFPVMGDPREERLFTYYKSYRANVRAKVNSLRARDAANDADRRRSLNETEKYLQLMKRYLEPLR